MKSNENWARYSDFGNDLSKNFTQIWVIFVVSILKVSIYQVYQVFWRNAVIKCISNGLRNKLWSKAENLWCSSSSATSKYSTTFRSYYERMSKRSPTDDTGCFWLHGGSMPKVPKCRRRLLPGWMNVKFNKKLLVYDQDMYQDNL